MTRLTAVAAALLLAACKPEPTPQIAPAWVPAALPTASVKLEEEVWKFCDADRAIYVFDGYKQGGIAVVENAAECVEVLS